MTAERAGSTGSRGPTAATAAGVGTQGAPHGAGAPGADGADAGEGRVPSHTAVPGCAAAPGCGRVGGSAGGPDGGHWAPGTPILWRYRANGTRHPHICRPVTVVRDTPELLAAWVAPGTVCVKPELADGTPVHHEPLATRYTKPRRTVLSRWFGTGVLKLASPEEPWSVWLFWERDWQFKNWYVNLEEPRRRWRGGIDSEDHFLDIAIYPDRSWEWRDEDEFAAAQRAGLVDDALAARVRAAGRAVIERISAWASPFRDGWEHWRPDPHWPVPPLPQDWDGCPPPGGAGPAGPGRLGSGQAGSGQQGSGQAGAGQTGSRQQGSGQQGSEQPRAGQPDPPRTGPAQTVSGHADPGAPAGPRPSERRRS